MQWSRTVENARLRDQAKVQLADPRTGRAARAASARHRTRRRPALGEPGAYRRHGCRRGGPAPTASTPALRPPPSSVPTTPAPRAPAPTRSPRPPVGSCRYRAHRLSGTATAGAPALLRALAGAQRARARARRTNLRSIRHSREAGARRSPRPLLRHGDRRPFERRVLHENRALEFLQRPTGFDAELL